MAVQAAGGVAVLGVYTVALVILLGGGDDGAESPDPERPLSALERRVKQGVERGRVPQQSDADDVSGFRAPSVVSVSCEDDACKVVYSVAVPGRGRIALQQVDIVRRIFGETDVERLELEVVRGEPRGPLASPKSEEETPVGIPLHRTTCDRDKGPDDVDWGNFRRASAAFTAMCETRDLFQGGPGGVTGAPGSGAGGE